MIRTIISGFFGGLLIAAALLAIALTLTSCGDVHGAKQDSEPTPSRPLSLGNDLAEQACDRAKSCDLFKHENSRARCTICAHEAIAANSDIRDYVEANADAAAEYIQNASCGDVLYMGEHVLNCSNSVWPY